MGFLRKIENETRLDRIRNQLSGETLQIVGTADAIQQGQLRWEVHVLRKGENRSTKKVY